MTPSSAAGDSSSRQLAQFQALVQLDSAERRRELERIRRADPATAAALDDLLAHHASAREDGFLAEDELPQVQALPPGTWIGPYEIVRLLGHGGMGAVYLAHRHEPYHQDVALKRMRPGLPRRLVARFHAERQIQATLVHPGIARLLDGGDDADGSPYLVMDYVAGSRLNEYCRDRAPTLDGRVRLVHAVAEALAYAHRQGIVHRDLKPSNVLVDADGRPRVTDFGLAKLISAAGPGGATETGMLLGTPPYMAPERLTLGPGRDEPGGDVYALGVILFSLAARRLPFPSAVAIDGCVPAVREDAPPLRRIDPTIPRDLETIAAKALARDPRDRFADAGALAEQLGRYLAGEPLTIRPPTLSDRLGRWTARHRRALLAWGASFALALLAMIGILTAWNRGLQRDRDALRATMKTFWQASTALFEDLPVDHPALRPFSEDLVRSAEEIRGRGLLAADPGLDRQVAVMHRHLAMILEYTDRWAEALPHLDQSVALLRPLPPRVADLEARSWTEFDLFRSLTVRTSVLQALGRPDAAMADSDEALGLIRGLVARFPSDPAWREAQSTHLLCRARLLDRLGRTDDAQAVRLDALGLARQAVDLAPDDGVKLNTLLRVHQLLGVHSTQAAEEERHLRSACDVGERIGRLPGGGDLHNQHARVDAIEDLGDFLVRQGHPAEALALYAETLPIVDSGLARWPYEKSFQEQRQRITESMSKWRELLDRQTAANRAR